MNIPGFKKVAKIPVTRRLTGMFGRTRSRMAHRPTIGFRYLAVRLGSGILGGSSIICTTTYAANQTSIGNIDRLWMRCLQELGSGWTQESMDFALTRLRRWYMTSNCETIRLVRSIL